MEKHLRNRLDFYYEKVRRKKKGEKIIFFSFYFCFFFETNTKLSKFWALTCCKSWQHKSRFALYYCCTSTLFPKIFSWPHASYFVWKWLKMMCFVWKARTTTIIDSLVRALLFIMPQVNLCTLLLLDNIF